MELFVLALLAAVAALDEQGAPNPTPTPPQLPPPNYPHPEEDRFAYQRHAIEFWHGFMGEPITLWTEAQDAAWMLDEFICPEGHRADQSDTIVLEQNPQMISEPVHPGTPTPFLGRGGTSDSIEKSRLLPDGTYDVYEAVPPTGYCNHVAHRGPRRFTVPYRVLENIELKESMN